MIVPGTIVKTAGALVTDWSPEEVNTTV